MLLAMLRCYMSNAGCMMQKTPVAVGPGLETAKHILMLVRVRTSGRWLMPAKQSQFGCQHLDPFPVSHSYFRLFSLPGGWTGSIGMYRCIIRSI